MLHEGLYEQMEYFHIFDRHEGLRWNLNRDIPWRDLRAEAVRDEEVAWIRTASLSEFTTLSASHTFLREFVDDPDFSSWVSIWFYEEMKHHYALRRWLHLLGVDLRQEEILPRLRPYPDGASRVGTWWEPAP